MHEREPAASAAAPAVGVWPVRFRSHLRVRPVVRVVLRERSAAPSGGHAPAPSGGSTSGAPGVVATAPTPAAGRVVPATPPAPYPPSAAGAYPAPPPAPGPAPLPTSDAGAGQPADLVPRFLAKLVDVVVMFFINLVVATFVAFGLNSGYARTAMAALLSTAVTLAYYAFLESSRGQTVGKMVVGLKVQNLAGQNPTMEQALKRNVYIALGFLTIIPILGFLGSLAQLAAVIYIAVTINSDRPLFRGWHDKFADTQVIKTR
jgi:uncharacterized RDD family membrane protein YckC